MAQERITISSVTTDAIQRRQKLLQLMAQLKNERISYEADWRALAKFFKPRRARFSVSEGNRGGRRTGDILDSTGTFALRTLQSGMMSGMTSPARQWFRLTTPDPDLSENGQVKQWLHDVAMRMYTVFARSNLYRVLPTLYGDAGGFGTGVMLVDEHPTQVIRCYEFPLGSYWLANDDELRVRTFGREWRMTVRQLVRKFGKENCSKVVQEAYDLGQYETWVPVTHLIYPNPSYDGISLRSQDKLFASCYFESGGAQSASQGGLQPAQDQPIGFLRESGYDEFPLMCLRWETTGEDVYGADCPGLIALSDVQQLQKGEKDSLRALSKKVDPPMVGPPELMSTGSTILPGGVTYVAESNGKGGFRPAHEVNFDFQDLEFKQNTVRQRIERAMFADLWLMLSTDRDPNMGRQPLTATEVVERKEEKLIALGPVLEQANQDLLDPLIDRTFNIMMRRGLIPPPPADLQGKDLRVEYVSILHQAQKAVAAQGMERFTGFVSQLAATDPSVWDKVDRDQVIDEYANIMGMPPRTIVPDDQVQEVRKARAQAQQQQATAEALAKAAPAAKALSETDPSAGVLGNVVNQLPLSQGAGGLNA